MSRFRLPLLAVLAALALAGVAGLAGRALPSSLLESLAASPLPIQEAAQAAGSTQQSQSIFERGKGDEGPFDAAIRRNAERMIKEGRQIFRFDTFGDEAFWADALKLHQAIAGARFGGSGPGVSPAAALALGLKIDAEALPPRTLNAIRHGRVDLDDVAVTMALLDADAVVGVTGRRDEAGTLVSFGLQCSFCHSIVDNSVAPGIGRRLDGWPNRDLNVGAIVALAPDLSVIADLLQTDQGTVRKALSSWGPGRFDAQLFLDGKAFRPDGTTAATLIPAAFGLAGVNLHTYTGWGGISHWNAFVANLEMHGKGTFIDSRLDDPVRFPVAAAAGSGRVRSDPDLITSKLAALQFYQLSIPAPEPPQGSFDSSAARRGRAVFNGAARCSTCHVPPLFTEPGWNMHTAAEIGIDDFQSSRSPDERYRTTPLGGLFTRQKGGFYHDGRFADLRAVVEHYNQVLNLNLSAPDASALIEYLKSL
jgi:hypothetical protein